MSVAGWCRRLGRRTPSSAPSRSLVVVSGSAERSARAIRVGAGTPPARRTSTSSDSSQRSRSWAAVAPERRSIRMSRGAGVSPVRKLKPRSSSSSWKDETPRSMSTPSTCSRPLPRTTSARKDRRACTSVAESLWGLRRMPACSSTSASRSSPISRPSGPSSSRIRSACPPAPSVASTMTCPGRGRRRRMICSSITGMWSILTRSPSAPDPSRFSTARDPRPR